MASGAQAGRHRRDLGRESVAWIVADAVLEGQQPGQDAGMRGERDDGVGVSEIEAEPSSGQSVEIGSGGPAAVGPERVGAQGVYRDEQDVLVDRPQDGRRGTRRPEDQQQEGDGARGGGKHRPAGDPPSGRSGGVRPSAGLAERPVRSAHGFVSGCRPPPRRRAHCGTVPLVRRASAPTAIVEAGRMMAAMAPRPESLDRHW